MKQILSTITALFFSINFLQADFVVITAKFINATKDIRILARMDSSEKKMLEGLIKLTKIENGKFILEINWVAVLDSKGRTAVDSLFTKKEIDKTIITSGTQLVVNGELPKFNEDTPKKVAPRVQAKKELPNKSNSTTKNSTTNSTNIASPATSPIDNKINNNNMVTPSIISSYEGCHQIYNPRTEVIDIFKQEYYFDNKGKKIQMQNCEKVKSVPAKYNSCDSLDDFVGRATYKRRQAYFTEDEKQFSAGGCIPVKTYKHEFSYDSCEVIVTKEHYLKTGKVYYKDEAYQKTYLTDCVLNPYTTETKILLKVDFKDCEVKHDLDKNISRYFGKYYYIDEENNKHVVSSCMFTYLSQITQNVEFIKWEYFDTERYAKKWQKRYILYPKDSQQYELQPDVKIFITGNETDKIRHNYQQTSLNSNILNHNLSDIKSVTSGKPKGYPPTTTFHVLSSERICTGNQGIQCHTYTKYQMNWVEYEKMCSSVYKRPDNSILNNTWTSLLRNWDRNLVINSICK